MAEHRRIVDGPAVRRIRQEQGLTAATLARRAGMSTSGLLNVETGHRRGSARLAIGLAYSLGVHPDRVMVEDEDEDEVDEAATA